MQTQEFLQISSLVPGSQILSLYFTHAIVVCSQKKKGVRNAFEASLLKTPLRFPGSCKASNSGRQRTVCMITLCSLPLCLPALTWRQFAAVSPLEREFSKLMNRAICFPPQVLYKSLKSRTLPPSPSRNYANLLVILIDANSIESFLACRSI